MVEKRRRLERLREQIVREVYLREWREVWFFPPYNGVQGWRGTGPAFFVGLNASTGRFPDRAVTHLYDQLKLNGLGHVHLTDLVKERATSNDAEAIFLDDTKMGRYRQYFQEELRILDPQLIVGMGKKAFCWLNKWLPDDPRLRKMPMPHYAPRFWNPHKQHQIAKEIREIAAELRQSRTRAGDEASRAGSTTNRRGAGGRKPMSSSA